MDRIPIAVQLYSVREQCQEDLPGTLEAIHDMGYEGVEFAGYYGYSAEELRQMLDDLGLAVAGTHTGLSTLMPDELEATVEFNRILGNRNLVVPGLPEERRGSKEAWLETAALFADLAEQVKPLGMRVGYHNHTVEFRNLGREKEKPWDIFFTATSPEVIMQVDTGNAMAGGGEPGALINNYPGRAKTVHLKEYHSKNKKALIGEGQVNWRKVFRACETVGDTEWYIVEQESYAYEPLECIARCLDALEAMGK
ncbi:MAG: sugar phosphate isomerase/epimerase [Candidatus Brocadiia bacterium]